MKLKHPFYHRPALEVAPALIGKVLVRNLNGLNLAGKIVETEAYVGPHDLACHASKGRTPRTEVMFGPPGYAYIYMVYGFHHCLNVVTDSEGYPAAVLIRALEPVDHIERMRSFRKGVQPDTAIASGPGKLCQAMSIDKRLNRADLAGSLLWIEDRGLETHTVDVSPRVGVGYAGEYKDKPWRFFVAGNAHVSNARFK